MTFVEKLVAEGRDKFDEVAAPIEEFFNHPRARGALRLVLVGLAGGNRQDANWSGLHEQLTKLFSFPKAGTPEFHGNTLRRFGHALGEQRLRYLHAYIALLACHILHSTPNIRERAAVREGLETVDFVHIIERYLKTKNPYELNIERNSPLDLRGIYGGVRRALGTDKSDTRAISRQFFLRTDEAEDLVFKDQSFYVCYRYSVSSPQIIKTFLAINSPNQSSNDTFTFVHIYKTKNPRGTTVNRISRGAIIGFENVFYLFGASARSIGGTMDKARGIKAIAIPAESFRYEQHLLTGVFLSTSLQWKPIIGRVALVHLGFKSKLNRGITDSDIDLTSLTSSRKLIDDLKLLFADQNKSENEIAEMANFVREQISNRPHTDLTSDLGEVFCSLTVEDLDERD